MQQLSACFIFSYLQSVLTIHQHLSTCSNFLPGRYVTWAGRSGPTAGSTRPHFFQRRYLWQNSKHLIGVNWRNRDLIPAVTRYEIPCLHQATITFRRWGNIIWWSIYPDDRCKIIAPTWLQKQLPRLGGNAGGQQGGAGLSAYKDGWAEPQRRDSSLCVGWLDVVLNRWTTNI